MSQAVAMLVFSLRDAVERHGIAVRCNGTALSVLYHELSNNFVTAELLITCSFGSRANLTATHKPDDDGDDVYGRLKL